MSFLHGLTTDRRRLLASVIVVLAVAAFVRFYNIQWSFSNNGIDEGVMLERSLMVSRGYALYTELPCDQAPLAFYLGAQFGGDPIILRSLDATLSVLAIAACMEAARRIKGNVAMLATGILLTVDFAFLRESRLFSLDGMSSFFLAYSVLLFVLYVQKHSRLALAGSGLMVGMSATSKLFGVLGLLGMIVFILLEMRRAKSTKGASILDLLLVTIVAAVPMTMFLMALGPSDMLQGMVFDQGHRSFDPFLKLSIPLYFGLNLAYALPLIRVRSLWKAGPEHRFLMTISLTILAFMVFEPLVFFHHMVLLSPTLAILAGVVIGVEAERRKGEITSGLDADIRKKSVSMNHAIEAVFLAGLLVSAGLAAYGLALQGETWQSRYAERMNEITGTDDWVISGDPLVAAYAGRAVPPDMVNLAFRIHPDFTIEDVESAIVNYNVSVVVVSYRLNDYWDLLEFLGDHNYSLATENWIGQWERSVLDIPADPYGPLWFFVRNDIVNRYDIPTTDWQLWVTSGS